MDELRDKSGVVMKYLDVPDWEASFRAMRVVARQLFAALGQPFEETQHTPESYEKWLAARDEALRVAREAGLK